MARKKKIEEEQSITQEPEYVICLTRNTNFSWISMKTGVSVETLRALNPDIRFGAVGIPAGRRVRIR